jgi:hypothetical protein
MSDSMGRRREALSNDALEAQRTFVDAEGVHWYVYEQAFSEYDRRSGVSLIFSSDAAVRRVRDYPDNWVTLSDAQLTELSWKA